MARIDLQKFLLRVFASTLRRNRSNRPLDQFQQCLLYTFAGHIAGNGRIIRFARNFVDFIDIHNPSLGFFDIVIAFLQQFLNNVFHIFADITRFG